MAIGANVWENTGRSEGHRGDRAGKLRAIGGRTEGDRGDYLGTDKTLLSCGNSQRRLLGHKRGTLAACSPVLRRARCDYCVAPRRGASLVTCSWHETLVLP